MLFFYAMFFLALLAWSVLLGGVVTGALLGLRWLAYRSGGVQGPSLFKQAAVVFLACLLCTLLGGLCAASLFDMAL